MSRKEQIAAANGPACTYASGHCYSMAIGNKFDFLIQWHLTERCNLRCTHCYQEGSRHAVLSVDEVRAGLDEIEEMFSSWSEAHGIEFSPSFNITGGEPLLRIDLFEILGFLADREWETFVLTNGTLVDSNTARRFSDLGVSGVQISL